jgi:hypothetical protein
MISKGTPFTYVRFSDGENEILRNRQLVINNGLTLFKGTTHRNNFPAFDKKIFDPLVHKKIREDLLYAVTLRRRGFFKGVTTSNISTLDRDFMVRLNGGMDDHITFADLLMNSNYLDFRNSIVPAIVKRKRISIVGNFRINPCPELSHAVILKVPDNFFSSYEETYTSVVTQVSNLPLDTLVLSSASSLSNVVGAKVLDLRPDLTFIDVGTAINDLIGLPMNTRRYHMLVTALGWRQRLGVARYRMSKEFKLNW